MALIYKTQQLTEVYANSGSAKDIQNAVDQAALAGGGDVRIPEGTFNFVEVGEPWMTVIINAGVNVFGAPTQRDVNNQVITWNTTLVMPSDVPGSDTVGIPAWFKMQGTGDRTKPSRFSDIKLMGYRSINPASTSMHNSIVVTGVVDFRIDHNYFLDCTAGIYVFAASKNGICRGVIDHNRLVNTIGDPGYTNYATRTIDYGIMPYRTSTSDYWDSNIYNVLGKYTDYTVFIEDNYFSRWRHCVASINGMHYVFRHNTVEDDYGAGTIDGHGKYTYAGTRAMEVYENQFLDPNYEREVQPNVISWRGGGGVFFNNTIRDYYFAVYLRNEGDDPKMYPGSADCPVYFWNNTNLRGGAHYDQLVFFAMLPWSPPNVFADTVMPNYTPYPYPHPLTLEPLPTPYSAILNEGTYKITMPSSVVANGQTYNFVKWEDNSTNPIRTINLTSDLSLMATYELSLTALTANSDGPYSAKVDNPTIQFIGSASGGVPSYSWLWDFGDGTTSIEQNPIHTYPATEAVYNVTLTVTDSLGASAVATTTVTISPTPSAPLFHTRIWTAARNLKTISARWNWPIIEVYDQAARRIYTSRGAK